jgi:hypothetical protein
VRLMASQGTKGHRVSTDILCLDCRQMHGFGMFHGKARLANLEAQISDLRLQIRDFRSEIWY